MTELRRLYTEVQAAETVGISPRSLRSERTNGRIAFKRVAGKIMYRYEDLVAWERESERCQVIQARTPRSAKTEQAKAVSADSIKRALAVADKLKRVASTGAARDVTASMDQTSAPVIALRQQ